MKGRANRGGGVEWWKDTSQMIHWSNITLITKTKLFKILKSNFSSTVRSISFGDCLMLMDLSSFQVNLTGGNYKLHHGPGVDAYIGSTLENFLYSCDSKTRKYKCSSSCSAQKLKIDHMK